jgi:hypothetical protein
MVASYLQGHDEEVLLLGNIIHETKWWELDQHLEHHLFLPCIASGDPL